MARGAWGPQSTRPKQLGVTQGLSVARVERMLQSLYESRNDERMKRVKCMRFVLFFQCPRGLLVHL